MSRNLIIPVAADKMEYMDKMPYVFGLGDDGIIICIKSILGLPLDKFDHIYFSIIRKHEERFFVCDSLYMQCRRLSLKNVKIVILDQPTSDQVETVYQTIQKEDICGSIFVKDGDSFFELEDLEYNGVAVYPIEGLDYLDPRNKSYVAIDDMHYITNIIEKSVIGHYISAGGYAFEDSNVFCRYRDLLRGYGRLYLSHIIYAMLLDGYSFRPMEVSNYRDWGTQSLYIMGRNAQGKP